MDISSWVAGGSLVASVVSAFAASKSASLANQTISENRKIAESSREISLNALESNSSASKVLQSMFKRQYIFELHNAWGKVCDISKESPNVDDAITGANTLTLTAAVWLHDVMDKNILHQTYGKDYIHVYNSLYSIEDDLPCTKKSGREMLTDSVTRVFNEMNARNDHLTQTSVISS